jgi:hypothetical protein
MVRDSGQDLGTSTLQAWILGMARTQSTAMPQASWIAATALGWAVGWALGSGLAGEEFGGPVSAAIGGTFAGLAQGVVLARAGYTWGSTWALVSSGPVLVSVGAGVAVSIASSGRLYGGVVGVPAIVILPALFQWWVLRKMVGVHRAGWWPLAVLAGFIAGGAAVSLIRFGVGIPLGASGAAVLGAVGGAILGGMMAAVSGPVLAWLTASPRNTFTHARRDGATTNGSRSETTSR